MILSVDKVELVLDVVFATTWEALVDDSLGVLSVGFFLSCVLASLMDFESNGKGCCSCLMAEEGINLAPETLLLVWTDATIIQPSVVDGVISAASLCSVVLSSCSFDLSDDGSTFFLIELYVVEEGAIVVSSWNWKSSVVGGSVESITALSTKPEKLHRLISSRANYPENFSQLACR